MREGVVVRAGLFLEKARIAFSLVGGDFVDGGGDFCSGGGDFGIVDISLKVCGKEEMNHCSSFSSPARITNHSSKALLAKLKVAVKEMVVVVEGVGFFF